MTSKLTADQQEIMRLQFELQVLRDTIAMYGNSLLAAPWVQVAPLSEFHQFTSYPGTWVNRANANVQIPPPDHISVMDLNVQVIRGGATDSVSLFRHSSHIRFDARGKDLRQYRFILALVKAAP